MASDLLTTLRAEIDDRLRELRPLVSEHERLLAAVDALADAGPGAPAKPAASPPRDARSSATSPAETSSAPDAYSSESARSEVSSGSGASASSWQPDPSSSEPGLSSSESSESEPGPSPSASSESEPDASASADPAQPRRRGRPRGSAAGTIRAASSSPTGEEGEASGDRVAPKQERAARGAAQQAILAALEHGSHTVAELVVVTAMTGANIRGNLRRLLKERTITRTKREGKAAYALSSPPPGG